MDTILDSSKFNMILLLTILGEFFVPWLLKHFYASYDSKTMVISILGSSESPVRIFYNAWLIWLGGFLLFTSIAFLRKISSVSLSLAILIFLSIFLFAIGSGLLAGLFSVNESKEVATLASKIHDVSSAIGFMALLFFPLLSGILAFKENNKPMGIFYIIVFILTIVFFTLFIIGEKESFKDTIISYEGIWERLTLFTMYIPFICKAVSKLIH